MNLAAEIARLEIDCRNILNQLPARRLTPMGLAFRV
jgi:hypothetical protein